MAFRSFKVASFTSEAVADAVSYGVRKYMGLMGGSTTQRIKVSEVYIGGQATASAPSIMLVSRDSTVNITPTALTTGESDTALDPSTAALAAAPVAFVTASTQPQRSATAGLLNLTFNAFGGIVRWVAAPNEELGILGNTQPLGEISLSGFTGSTPALMGAHIVYEPL